MSLFSDIASKVRSVGSVTNSARNVGQAINQATNAFQNMSNDEMTHGGMMGNPQVARGVNSYVPENYEDEDEEDDYGTSYDNQPQLRIITDEMNITFQRKAKLKYEIISGKLRDQNNWRRLIATLVIEDTGDKEIAKKYKNLDDDEVKDLDKSIQRIIRNQKHLQKINAISISKEIELQCVEFFVMEFVDDYMAGREPDFSGINAIELLFAKFKEPYNELIADIAIDYGLELKPKAMEFFKKVYIKILGKQVDELNESLTEVIPETAQQPSAEVVVEEKQAQEIAPLVLAENEPETNIVKLSTDFETEPSKRWGVNPIEFPTLEVEHFEHYLASKGIDYDDILWNENEIFQSPEAKLMFLKEFDKFAEIRSKLDEEDEDDEEEEDKETED